MEYSLFFQDPSYPVFEETCVDIEELWEEDGLPHYYQKLNAQGEVLGDDEHKWLMVRDITTGLVWEVKSVDAAVHDNYSLYDLDNARAYIQELNKANWGGSSAWRLPTVRELFSILNYNYYRPCVDPMYFPHTIPDCYWTEQSESDWDDGFWVVNFLDGSLVRDIGGLEYYIRAVCTKSDKMCEANL
jgi:hypothetical protein